MADLIQRYGYDFREDGSIVEIDTVALVGDKNAQDALQKRLKADQHKPIPETGVHMHSSGGRVRFPELVPMDEWVRPTLKIGSEHPRPSGRMWRRRPHFVRPRAAAKDGDRDDEGGEEVGSRDASERLAAVEAVIAGARAAGWGADYKFGRGEDHTDAACWKEIRGRKVHVAFRIQLGHRLRFEFGDKEREYRDRGIQLVWLLSDKHAAQEPDRPEGIPVVTLRPAGDGGPGDGFLVDARRSPRPVRALALEDYAEALLREAALRLDPEPRPFPAPIGWLTCPRCGQRSLGFGDFELTPGDAEKLGVEPDWRKLLLPGRSLDPASIADRRALLAFRERVAEHCHPDPVAELSWSAPEGSWCASFHCPAQACGFALDGPMVPREGRPSRVAARLRLSVAEIDALIGPLDGLRVRSSVFPPLRVGNPSMERAAEALEAAEAHLADVEDRHQKLVGEHRATLAEIAQVGERIARITASAEDLAADEWRLAGVAAQEDELPGLRARLIELQPRARGLPGARARCSELDAAVARLRAERDRLAEAARAASEIERRLADHDTEAAGLLETRRAEWRAAELSGAIRVREDASAALRGRIRSDMERGRRLRGLPRPVRLLAGLSLLRAAWTKCQKRRLASALHSARIALAARERDIASPGGIARHAQALAPETGRLASLRAGLERDLEAARAAGGRCAELDARLDGESGLEAEQAASATRLAAAEAAAREAAYVAAELERAERATAEATRLRRRMAETELALGAKATLEAELRSLLSRAAEIEGAIVRSCAALRAARDAAALAEADLAFAAEDGVPHPESMAAE